MGISALWSQCQVSLCQAIDEDDAGPVCDAPVPVSFHLFFQPVRSYSPRTTPRVGFQTQKHTDIAFVYGCGTGIVGKLLCGWILEALKLRNVPQSLITVRFATHAKFPGRLVPFFLWTKLCTYQYFGVERQVDLSSFWVFLFNTVVCYSLLIKK